MLDKRLVNARYYADSYISHVTDPQLTGMCLA